MRTITWATFIILSLGLLSRNIGNAEKILVVLVASFYSHNTVHQSLSLALNKRGHEIVIVTSRPMKDETLKNYTEIYTPNVRSIFEHFQEEIHEQSMTDFNDYASRIKNKASILILDELERRDFYKNEKFDAVIVEAGNPSLFVLAHKFNAPLIGVLSMGQHIYHRYIFGSPVFTSHPSVWEINTLVEENMSIWQRLQNFIEVWQAIYQWINGFAAVEQEIAIKYIGKDVPPIIDVMKNMSLLLVNENPIFTYPTPNPSNVIFFNSFHIQKTPPSLSKDLRQFLDDATEGFIYVSFGSITSCCHLSKELLDSFIEVFSKLPYKIVWKCGCHELLEKLDNAFISKWFSQQGVLAHPNIKLFIYQGGTQSTEEAIHYAVPLLGIPFVNEQEIRIRRLASLGVAIHMKLKEVTRENLDRAIHQILDDKSYKERMTYISSVYKDQPYDSMEHAIWWIEFAMRRKGIKHLRLNEYNQQWYQYYDVDVIVLLSITLFVVTCIIMLIIFHILSFILNKIMFLTFRNSKFLNMKRWMFLFHLH